MLQRAVDRVALRRAQLVEVAVDPLARLRRRARRSPPRRYLTTSSRARTAWEMSSSMETVSDYSTSAGLMASIDAPADRVGELQCRRRAAEIARAHRAGRQHRAERRHDAIGRRRLRRCAAASAPPTAAAPSDSRCSCPAMSGALPCTASNTPMSAPRFAAPTTPRPPTRPAHRSDTMSPYRFGSTQHVELLGVHHQVHARGVDDPLVVRDVRVLARDAPDALEEQAVAQLHDVGLVDRRHRLAAVPRARARTRSCAMRVDAFSVMIFRLSTTPGTTSCSRPA